jgi:hypothetical protein
MTSEYYYRPHIGSTVRLERKTGPAIEGILHSVTPNSAWMLVGDADEFVALGDIVTMERT